MRNRGWRTWAAVGGVLLLTGGGHLTAEDVRIGGLETPVSVGSVSVLSIHASEATRTLTVEAFGQSWPALRRSAADWTVVIGVDLDREPGRYPVTVMTEGAGADASRIEAALQVGARRFRRRVLTVAPEYVNPPPELTARIAAESHFVDHVYASSTMDAAWAEGFARPVPGPANSSFGTRSVFNGEARSPHAGTDFLSGSGTPVHAPGGGRVVAARDLFFSGNTVIIDHGRGLFSMLAHLSRIDVREGAAIARGTVVGLVGATGRVTGPHLHWAMRVQGARVDPLSVLRRLPAAPDAKPGRTRSAVTPGHDR